MVRKIVYVTAKRYNIAAEIGRIMSVMIINVYNLYCNYWCGWERWRRGKKFIAGSGKMTPLALFFSSVCFFRTASAVVPYTMMLSCRTATDTVYCTRAINLFKCYSEIISKHDRVQHKFKFVLFTIFRRVVPPTTLTRTNTHTTIKYRHIAHPTPLLPCIHV